MEISEIFSAAPKSSFQLLGDPGVGFYVPAYQREYSWDQRNIYRLFEEVALGLNHLLESEDAITFIGTVISIHDNKYQTVHPLVREDVPSRVMLIIDGQQRITTLLIAVTALHEQIALAKVRLEGDSSVLAVWLKEKATETLRKLQSVYEQDMAYGDGALQWYPRLIRAYEDTWSRKKEKAKYASPIARHLFHYGSHARSDNSSRYSHDVASIPESAQAKFKALFNNFGEIRKILRGVAFEKGSVRLELPSFADLAGSETLQETLFNSVLPDSVVVLLKGAEGKKEREYQGLIVLMVLARFLLDRVAVTVVTAKNEDYAFDMFEALNTTGEPLTAFETFKPRVVQAEGLADYETSASRKSMLVVEQYLSGFEKAQDRQDATSNLLVPFALAETGEKLSRRLSVQRRYVKDTFDLPIQSKIDEKRLYIRHLAHVALFLDKAWLKGKGNQCVVPDVPKDDDALVHLCVRALRAASHDITVAPMARYFSTVQLVKERQPSDPDAYKCQAKELVTAIKALTAFFVFWRGSRTGTERIDDYYRDLLQKGRGNSLRPLARHPGRKSGGELPSAADFRDGLRDILNKEGCIKGKEEWVKKACRTPVYKVSSALTRFMLLVATHQTIPDEATPGLVIPARKGMLDLLTVDAWNDFEQMSIEHVAPQVRRDGDWDSALYDDPDTVEQVGNLALIPLKENASISNRSWDEKRHIYKILSATTEKQIEWLIGAAGEEIGSAFKARTAEILAKSKYLPHLASIADVNESWSVNLLNRRSECLAGLVWDRLAPWLGIEVH